jgi:hypothetical protein
MTNNPTRNLTVVRSVSPNGFAFSTASYVDMGRWKTAGSDAALKTTMKKQETTLGVTADGHNIIQDAPRLGF